VTSTPPVASTPHPCDRYVEVALSFDRIARLASVQIEYSGAIPTIFAYEDAMVQSYESLPAGAFGMGVFDYLDGAFNEFMLAISYARQGDEERALEAARMWRQVTDLATARLETGGCAG
jgi:hypothetical protein